MNEGKYNNNKERKMEKKTPTKKPEQVNNLRIKGKVTGFAVLSGVGFLPLKETSH